MSHAFSSLYYSQEQSAISDYPQRSVDFCITQIHGLQNRQHHSWSIGIVG
jgi:hypothetical protein